MRGRWATLALWLLLAGAPAAAADPDPVGVDAPGADVWERVPAAPDALRGFVQQSLLPVLSERLEAARARRDGARAVRSGTVRLAEGWPELAATDANEPRALDATLLALDRAAVANLADARRPVPVTGDRRLDARVRTLWDDVVQTESDAIAARRLVVLALQDQLARHPAWTARAVAAARAPLDAAWASATAAPEAGPDPSDDADAADARAALDRVAALGAARARWSQLTRDVVEGAFVDVSFDPAPELAALTSGDRVRARDALARLRALHPLLTPDAVAAVDAAVEAWVGGADVATLQAQVQAERDAVAAVATSPLPGDADALRAALAEAEAAVAATPPPVGPVPDDAAGRALRTLADAEAEVAQLQLQVAAARLARAEAVQEAADDDERRRADAAREAAERARAATGDHPAVAMRAASRTWTADAEQILANERSERTAAREGWATRLARLDAAAVALAEGRTPEGDAASWTLDTVYARNRILVGELRQAIDAAILPPEQLLAELPPLPEGREAQLAAWTQAAQDSEGPEHDAVLELLEDTRQAVAEEDVPRDEAQTLQDDTLDALLALLRDAKALKHRLRRSVSSTERGFDAENRGTDVQAEARLLGHQVRALVEARGRAVLSLPLLLVDPRRWVEVVERVADLLRGMTLLVLLIAVWAIARRRWRDLSDRVLRFADQWLVPLDTRARAALRPTVGVVVRSALDIGLAWLIAARLGDIALELGLLVRAWATWATLRGIGALLDVFLAPPGERRPAFAVLSDEGLALVRRSWRFVALWWFVGWLVDRLLADLIFADALADLANTVWWLAFAALVGWILLRWEPRMLARVQRMGTPPAWMTRWVLTRSGGPLAPVRAVVLLGYLGAAAAWDVAQGHAAERDSYRALFSVMDRVRFTAEDKAAADAPGLDEATIAALCSGDVPADAVVARKAAEETLAGHLSAWNADRRLGVVVLTGDRGDGKRVFLERMDAVLRLDGRPPRLGELDRRITSRDDAIAWFAAWFELDPVPPDVDTLVERLLEAPPQVHIVRRSQLAFLRKVGGFDGLATILDVCNATSTRHFWLLGMHRPAWAYLSRLGSILNTGVVRGVVDIAPLGGPDLRDLVLRRTKAAGLQVDFRRLENTGPFSAPPEVERERAVSSFFRLLADASGGCPLVALHLWSRSLRQGAADRWDVVLTPALASGDLGNLDDDEMFVLGALRIQDQMTQDELAAVLNMRPDDVRSVVRELSQRGILHLSDRGARIDTLKVRQATRTLRRRHFLQYAV